MVWKSVEPEVWKYENEGELIEGVLVEVVPKTDECGTKYYIENTSGQWIVYGTVVLDERMGSVKIGELVRVTYKGSKPNKDKRKNDTKIFKVEVNRE